MIFGTANCTLNLLEITYSHFYLPVRLLMKEILKQCFQKTVHNITFLFCSVSYGQMGGEIIPTNFEFNDLYKAGGSW
jgi:hypothetical protein